MKWQDMVEYKYGYVPYQITLPYYCLPNPLKQTMNDFNNDCIPVQAYHYRPCFHEFPYLNYLVQPGWWMTPSVGVPRTDMTHGPARWSTLVTCS